MANVFIHFIGKGTFLTKLYETIVYGRMRFQRAALSKRKLISLLEIITVHQEDERGHL